MASPTPNPKPTAAPDLPSTQQPPVIEDNELDPEIDMAIDPAPPDPENAALDETLPEPREATRKDISLRDFMGKMDDYAPIVCSPPSDLSLLTPRTPPSPHPLKNPTQLNTTTRSPTP